MTTINKSIIIIIIIVITIEDQYIFIGKDMFVFKSVSNES